jgi:pectin methylesterase-like acyl-CoA thioesterase
VVVAKSGGDFTSVQAALNSITTASAANPFLVYVAPGVYVEQVTLKPFVALEGAGEGTTIVRWTGGAVGSSYSDRSTMIGASNATVRSLSIESVAPGDNYSQGMYNNSSSPVLHNVSITATGGHASYGMYNDSSSPTLTDVSITATQSGYYNTGIHNTASSPTLTRVKVVASGPTGVQTKDYGLSTSSASAPIIKDSLISGRVWSIEAYNATAKVVNSQLIGGVDTGLTCFNNYNANFGAVTCP